MNTLTSLSPLHHRIMLIAGTGSLPIHAAYQLSKGDIPFLSLALFPEDNGNALAPFGEEVITESVYALGKIIQRLKEKKVTHVIFLGKVDKRMLLHRLSYDLLFGKLMAKATLKRDSDVMHLLIDELRNNNITTLSQRAILPGNHIAPGLICGTITPEIHRDITLGLNTAHTLSTLDIGQTVITKDGMILAVEALEGTDECIARGIMLGKDRIIVCKTAHPTHSELFDLPTLGVKTIQDIPKGRIAAIAWHSTRTFIDDISSFKKLAEEKQITLISLEATPYSENAIPACSQNQ